MPLYEYKCEQCGSHFEQLQKISEKPLKKCPKCGSKVKRLIGTGIRIIFKGPGFYVNDYGIGSKGSSNKKGINKSYNSKKRQ